MKSSIFSLVSTIIGGGALSLPLAFAKTGAVLGLVMLFGVSSTSAYSAHLLVSCSRRTGGGGYADVARAAYGTWMQQVVMVLVMLLTSLGAVAYLVTLGDLLPPVVALLFPHYSLNSERTWVIVVCALCVLPVCAMRDLHSLRFTSALSILAVLSLAATMGYRYHGMAQRESWPYVQQHLQLVSVGWGTLTAFSLMAVSFMCHFNVLPVHAELRRPSRVRVHRVLWRTMTACCVIYAVIGLLGYFSFFSTVCDDVLLNYSDGDPVITVGRVALACTVFLSFPLLAHPCRASVELLLFASRGVAPSRLRRWLLTLAIVSSVASVAVTVRSIVTVWSILGSSVAIAIAYILPALFYLKLRPGPLTHRRKLPALLLLCASCVLLPVCSYTTISATLYPPPTLPQCRK